GRPAARCRVRGGRGHRRGHGGGGHALPCPTVGCADTLPDPRACRPADQGRRRARADAGRHDVRRGRNRPAAARRAPQHRPAAARRAPAADAVEPALGVTAEAFGPGGNLRPGGDARPAARRTRRDRDDGRDRRPRRRVARRAAAGPGLHRAGSPLPGGAPRDGPGAGGPRRRGRGRCRRVPLRGRGRGGARAGWPIGHRDERADADRIARRWSPSCERQHRPL
ncbi:MAG: hypothetical protein AVDCRST_MAG49-3887, partial [uncultured Thermomicrobiales bacterium]